ncbi:MAG TPA: hypothetical protein PLT09_13235 [Deltaproteobacteria bacterium]|nr:hypothetical protein [Deltaproteobacteria bacterium]HPR54386.1 hypothetical protein [Deltaproteobacteria bacterium]HXK48405.1 hypothetical protein [Deltaproteobacteria bacterium]
MAKDSDGIDKTQKELLEEMAKALGSTGHQLETVLKRMKELESLLEQSRDDNEYNALVEKFNDLHKLALMRREMLVIHREAIKVFKHSYIDVFYPIPEKKRKRT